MTTTAATARVGLLGSAALCQAEWRQRGITAVDLRRVAVERWPVDPPDLIVLDPTDADQRRVDACWELGRGARVPVIAVSHDDNGAALARWYEQGADEVIIDQGDAAIVMAQVAAVLRRSRVQEMQRLPARLDLGHTVIDLNRRRVRRDGEEQSLSRTEFSLLVALLHAQEHVCTHHDLITQVWGPGYASAGHYLRLYIRYLREKLESDPRHPELIRNVWGIGYRLVLPVGRSVDAADA